MRAACCVCTHTQCNPLSSRRCRPSPCPGPAPLQSSCHASGSTAPLSWLTWHGCTAAAASTPRPRRPLLLAGRVKETSAGTAAAAGCRCLMPWLPRPWRASRAQTFKTFSGVWGGGRGWLGVFLMLRRPCPLCTHAACQHAAAPASVTANCPAPTGIPPLYCLCPSCCTAPALPAVLPCPAGS